MANEMKIRDMASQLYADETLAAAVVADAERLGTVKAIESGKLVLPHINDARRWLARKIEAEQRINEVS